MESYANKRQKATEIIHSRKNQIQDGFILEILTHLLNQNISSYIKELEDFFDRQASTCLESKSNKENNDNIHVCQQLCFSQKEQIKKIVYLFSSKRTGK